MIKRKVIVVWVLAMVLLGVQLHHQYYLPVVSSEEVRPTLKYPPPPIYITSTPTR